MNWLVSVTFVLPDIFWIQLVHEIQTISSNTIKENKRPIGHIAHLRKHFKSINTFDYIIMLIKRRKQIIIIFMRIYWFFIWRNLNPLHPRVLCAKIVWNWISGSEDFLISSMYFCYFLIISPWKRVGPFIWRNLDPHHTRMICAKFGWNWPSGSGEEDLNWFLRWAMWPMGLLLYMDIQSFNLS